MFPRQPRHCRGRAATAVVVEVVADVVAVDVTAVEAALGTEVATAVESLDVERVVVATHIIGRRTRPQCDAARVARDVVLELALVTRRSARNR